MRTAAKCDNCAECVTCLIREAEAFLARNDPSSYRVDLVRRLAAALAKEAVA